MSSASRRLLLLYLSPLLLSVRLKTTLFTQAVNVSVSQTFTLSKLIPTSPTQTTSCRERSHLSTHKGASASVLQRHTPSPLPLFTPGPAHEGWTSSGLQWAPGQELRGPGPVSLRAQPAGVNLYTTSYPSSPDLGEAEGRSWRLSQQRGLWAWNTRVLPPGGQDLKWETDHSAQ